MASTFGLELELSFFFLLAEALGQVRHDAQGIVPQGIDLYRLALPWGDDPVADLGVHPGQLHPLLSGVQKAIFCDADAVAGTALVPGDDVLQNGPEFGADKVVSIGVVEILVQGGEEPEGGVYGIVFGCLAGIREAVGDHALADVGGEGLEDAAGLGVASAHQADARQGDHGIAAPVGKPVVPGGDGVEPAAAAHQELVGGADELTGQGIRVDGWGHRPADTAVFLLFEQGRGIASTRVFRGDHDLQFVPGFQDAAQHPAGQQVLSVVQAALGLARVFEVVVPIRPRCKVGSGDQEVDQRLVGVRLKAQHIFCKTSLALGWMELLARVRWW